MQCSKSESCQKKNENQANEVEFTKNLALKEKSIKKFRLKMHYHLAWIF